MILFIFFYIHQSNQVTMQLCSFLLTDLRYPVPLTEAIWIRSGNLLQATHTWKSWEPSSFQALTEEVASPTASHAPSGSKSNTLLRNPDTFNWPSGRITKNSIHMETSVCNFCQSSTMSFLRACWTVTKETLGAQNHVHNLHSKLFHPMLSLVPSALPCLQCPPLPFSFL